MKTKKGYRLRTLGKEYILMAEGIEVVDGKVDLDKYRYKLS